MKKLNPKLKAKWLADLRSGKYEQCASVLYDGAGYCCLGVLYRVITGQDPKEYWEPDEVNVDAITSLKPAQVTFDDTVENHLARMNDGTHGNAPHSFAEIADWIEANL